MFRVYDSLSERISHVKMRNFDKKQDVSIFGIAMQPRLSRCIMVSTILSMCMVGTHKGKEQREMLHRKKETKM